MWCGIFFLILSTNCDFDCPIYQGKHQKILQINPSARFERSNKFTGHSKMNSTREGKKFLLIPSIVRIFLLENQKNAAFSDALHFEFFIFNFNFNTLYLNKPTLVLFHLLFPNPVQKSPDFIRPIRLACPPKFHFGQRPLSLKRTFVRRRQGSRPVARRVRVAGESVSNLSAAFLPFALNVRRAFEMARFGRYIQLYVAFVSFIRVLSVQNSCDWDLCV
jgi:hypothetical protein